jgi:uncharacterized protein YbaP (TraB family)
MHRVVVVTLAIALTSSACDRGARTESSTRSAAGSSVAPLAQGSSERAGSASNGAAARPRDGAPPPVPVATAPLAHPLLWTAEKAGHTTYFLGTMHLGIDAETRLPPIVWNKLDAATTFAMEADLDDPQLASMIKKSDSPLHEALGDAYWKKLEDAIGPTMAKAVDDMPPMVSATVLAMKGMPPTFPMDKALSARATSEHKTIVFLEPAVKQIEILRRWMDIKAIKMILDELPSAEQHAKEMLDAYAEGDERKILAINNTEKADALKHGYTSSEYDQELADLLYSRNASWIEPLEKLHAAGGGFVAVGALHLIGPRSVLDLLASKGYKVTRVTP